MADTSVLAQEAVQAVAPVASEQDKEDPPENSAFECNICYDLAQSPVVTMCGHLYCWPCLYRWVMLSSQEIVGKVRIRRDSC